MAEHIYKDYRAEYEQFEEEMEAEEVKTSYSKFIVALMFVTIIAFTVTCLVFYWNGKTVDPTLILSIFACFGLEFGSLAFIKSSKLKYVEGNPANKQMPHIEIEEEEDEQVSK